MSNINNLPNSLRWAAMQTLLQALRGAPELVGVRVVHNPRGPAVLKDGTHLVVLKDRIDAMEGKSGQMENRSHQFLLAAVARLDDDADRAADALHEAAAAVLRSTLKALLQETRVVNLSEVSTQFETESLETDGALCLSTWDLKYRKTGPQ
jgi:hypothetical protein